MQIRLDKCLADAGFGTRSEVKKRIKKGEVLVNGVKASGAEQKVDISQDMVTVNGTPVFYETFSYYIMNKPAGVLSATKDGKEKTVVDLIPEPKRRDLFPVGRLDKDTVGLLLITNDGKLSNRLMAPGKHVSKTYLATVTGELPEDLVERFRMGVDIGDETLTAPAEVQVRPEQSDVEALALPEQSDVEALALSEQSDVEALALSEQSDVEALTLPEQSSVEASAHPEQSESDALPCHELELTITEGRYHQVKRMFEAVGCRVIRLERTAIAGLTLPADLPRGSVRKLSHDELAELLGI